MIGGAIFSSAGSESLILTHWQWLVAFPLVYMIWNWMGPNGVRRVPTMGTSIPILAYLNGLRYTRNAKETLLAGYAKYARTTGLFKIAMADQWLVVVAGHSQLEELKQMTDDQISSYGGIDELLSATYILGSEVVANPYHMPLVHAKLTRNLSEFHGTIKEEMWTAFDDIVGSSDEWTSLPALETVLAIVARTSNRVFVGLPLCRDAEFLSIATNVTLDIAQSRFVINLFPPFMKPLVAKFVNKVPSRLRQAYALIGPLVEARRQKAEECAADKEEWEDKPNDFLMWLIDEAVKNNYTNENTVLYLLMVEFIALHTTGMSFAHALFYLAADPSLATPLRQEVEVILAEEDGDIGSRTAVSKMRLIDSFLRESQRLNGTNATSIWRKTLQTITFSNGITIPPGVFLSAAATATHLDEELYTNPEVFNPWRFVEPDNARSFVSLGSDYIVFGQGRHACPGRHFASYQMKLMLAHIVLNYDVKLSPGSEGIRPPNKWIGNSIIPDPTANVLFRKRNAV
ncbi:cytochrome P450 [Cristinia sonorae]|uniref:Cytochrome P450 n=1 Tax=Cristinia sonorae TaxID=1940300 RepID=A0A8K0XS57_9AGAR|nr:cytochrome P450 [Cristinia sonorae]